MEDDNQTFIERVIEAFRDQPFTLEVALRINEMHNIDIEKIKTNLNQAINKVFEK